MDNISGKVTALFLVGILLTGAAAGLTINIELFDFGDSSGDTNSTSNSTEDSGDDDEFTYGGSESDQITDEEGVEKSLMERIVGAVVNTIFG